MGGRSRSLRRAWTAWAAAFVFGLQSAAFAATYTWTGEGGADVDWSNPSNWTGAAPDDNEANVELVFPALAQHYSSNNDLTGLRVTSLAVATSLSDGDYLFTGNPIAFSGTAAMDSPSSGNPNLVWQIPLVLEGDSTIDTSGRQTQIQAAVDLGGRTLTLNTIGDLVLAGVISGSGNLVKSNGSALTITGANTYTGSTTSNAGALYIDSATAFGAVGSGTTFNGGVLGFSGSTFTTAEPVVFNGGGIIAYGMPTMSGPVTLNATIGIEPFLASTVLTMAGAIDGVGGLNMIGMGLLRLSAAPKMYAGATGVEEGTLQLDTSLASTQPVTVSASATLQGSGSSAGTVTVAAGGTVAPGASPGQLASAGLSMVADATLSVEIQGPIPAVLFDTVVVSGPVSLGGATLAVSLGYPPPDGQQFRLITQLPDQPVAGTFAGLSEGASFLANNTMLSITYTGGSGNDVVLVVGALPTPTSTATGPIPTATQTGGPSHTAAASATSTTAMTPTPPITPSEPMPTESGVPTPTPTEPPPACTGDCDGNNAVAINELVVGVNVALENMPATICVRFDADDDGRVTIPELIEAVGNALNGCP